MTTWQEMRARALLNGYRSGVRPWFFRAYGQDPERIHETMIDLLAGFPAHLRSALGAALGRPHDPVTVAGIRFPGRVGVAAGLDKEGKAAQAWASLGFAYAELGTVTAWAQPGNPKPRLFRLPQSQAVINRMGFNNGGAQALADRLSAMGVRRGQANLGIPLGVSIGKTKKTPLSQAVEDYLISLRAIYPVADYVAVNVSSPNTPGLRSLQDRVAIHDLTQAMVQESRNLAGSGQPMPVFVKVAPDLSSQQLDEILLECEDQGLAGVIATNTTLERSGLAAREQWLANQAGGLSGAPLTERSRQVVAYITAHTRLPVIGVGGIMTPADAQALFDLGAVLVQVYTGFIFCGPALISGINDLCRPNRGGELP